MRIERMASVTKWKSQEVRLLKKISTSSSKLSEMFYNPAAGNCKNNASGEYRQKCK